MPGQLEKLPNADEYKRVHTYMVCKSGCRLIVTEYFTMRSGREVQTRLTLKTFPSFGRPH